MKINLSLSRRRIYIIIIMGLIALASINFLSWLFLQSLKNDLTGVLKRNIRNVGQVSARLMNGNELEKIYPGMENSAVVLYYQNLLYDLKINNELENIVLLNPAGQLLVDFRLNYVIGDSLRSFPLQPELFRNAVLGEQTEPFMTRLGGQYFLSAYLPVLNDYGEIAAILIIDAPFTFFTTLRKFELGSIYLGLGGLGILLIFSAIILLSTQRLFRAEDRMRDQERLAQLGQMAASVAHEIRNPLSIMKGTAEVLKKKYDHISDEMFSYIPDEIERLNRLVNDFLQFARQKKPELTEVNLPELLAEISGQFNDPRIQIEADNKLPPARADKHALKQILLNLVNNAQDAIDPNGLIRVKLTGSSVKGKKISIEVIDNGKGIPAEDLPQVFDPFFSTKASGSGLGLAICKQLVEQMGGKLTIGSRQSKGTIVQVLLPTA
jgi:signal transduction histidine kinase